MIRRELKVQNVTPIENHSSLDNFYPCLCSGYSNDVKNCGWNKHSWTVVFYIISVKNPIVKMHFEIKCNNRTIANCVISYNRYTGKNRNIHILGNKFSDKWQRRTKADIYDFIRHMILIFGEVAYIEKNKRRFIIEAVENQNGSSLVKETATTTKSKNSPYSPNSKHNVAKIYKYHLKGKKPRHYTAESWVRAGRYIGNRYVESVICHRNTELLATSRMHFEN